MPYTYKLCKELNDYGRFYATVHFYSSIFAFWLGWWLVVLEKEKGSPASDKVYHVHDLLAEKRNRQT